MRAKAWIALAIATGLAVGWGVWQRPPHSVGVAQRSDGASASLPTQASVLQRADLSRFDPAAGAGDSLRGTQVDGALHLDSRGRPIADRDLRRVFDYFLTRTGERSQQQIRIDLQAYLHPVLDPAALTQVMAWFDSYVALQQASVSQAQAGGDLREGVMRLRALRSERMGPQIAEAWWGDEDRYLDYTLARDDILADRGLDADQRAAKLRELDGSLTPARLAQLQQDDTTGLIAAQQRDFAERKVPAGERFVERERTFGHEAAQRLADLDAKQAQWQQRLRDYAVARQK
ncbi:MAG: lipase secretion chaperone, partial [Lysobacter sp.]